MLLTRKGSKPDAWTRLSDFIQRYKGYKSLLDKEVSEAGYFDDDTEQDFHNAIMGKAV